MNILLWLIFGGLAGWIASLITGNDPSLGIIGNITVGIVGAFIGGWIADKVQIGSGGVGPDSHYKFNILKVLCQQNQKNNKWRLELPYPQKGENEVANP